jgi:hypothetical protein
MPNHGLVFAISIPTDKEIKIFGILNVHDDNLAHRLHFRMCNNILRGLPMFRMKMENVLVYTSVAYACVDVDAIGRSHLQSLCHPDRLRIHSLPTPYLSPLPANPVLVCRLVVRLPQGHKAKRREYTIPSGRRNPTRSTSNLVRVKVASLGIQVDELNEVIDKQPAEVEEKLQTEIIDRQKIGLGSLPRGCGHVFSMY